MQAGGTGHSGHAQNAGAACDLRVADDDFHCMPAPSLRPPPPCATCTPSNQPEPLLPPCALGGGFGRRYSQPSAHLTPAAGGDGRGLKQGPLASRSAATSGSLGSGSLDSDPSGSTPLECIIITSGDEACPPAARLKSIYDVRPQRVRWRLLAIAALTCMLLPASTSLYIPGECKRGDSVAPAPRGCLAAAAVVQRKERKTSVQPLRAHMCTALGRAIKSKGKHEGCGVSLIWKAQAPAAERGPAVAPHAPWPWGHPACSTPAPPPPALEAIRADLQTTATLTAASISVYM
jgi:hypothetical protein